MARNWPHVLNLNIKRNSDHKFMTNFRPRNCGHFRARWHRFFRFLEKSVASSGQEFGQFVVEKLWSVSGAGTVLPALGKKCDKFVVKKL